MTKMKFHLFGLILLCVITSCNKEVTPEPELVIIPPTGFIYIDSYPSGAKIYYDGRVSGKYTPDSISFLEERSYMITLKMPHYRDTSFQVDAADSLHNRLFIDYSKNVRMLGKIKCISDADSAVIYFNDSLTGHVTPYIIDSLLPGEYKIKYTKFSHRADSTYPFVESNQVTDAFIDLKDTTYWVDYTTATSALPDNYLLDLAIDQYDNLWIATRDYGLAKFNGINWDIFDLSNSGIISDNILSLEFDQGGRLWVGTYDGISIYNGSSWINYDSSNSDLPYNQVISLAADYNNGMWIGTFRGLAYFNNNNWNVYTASDSTVPGNWILSLAVDLNNEVWIGMNQNGMSRFDGTNWTAYIDSTGMPRGNSISAINVSDDNLKWIAHLPTQWEIGGLTTFNGSFWDVGFTALPSNNIKDIFIDKDNRKWISTAGGLVQFTVASNMVNYRTVNSEITNDNIISVVEDSKGDIWVATYGGGLNKFKFSTLLY